MGFFFFVFNMFFVAGPTSGQAWTTQGSVTRRNQAALVSAWQYPSKSTRAEWYVQNWHILFFASSSYRSTHYWHKILLAVYQKHTGMPQCQWVVAQWSLSSLRWVSIRWQVLQCQKAWYDCGEKLTSVLFLSFPTPFLHTIKVFSKNQRFFIEMSN